jgi:glutamate dehydrogenase
LNGVLLNTDFIDNSAGVDTSDHEVNIKILLNDAVQRGELTMDARNAQLAAMTDEVERLVLNDNYRQNQAISLMERMSVARLGSKQHFIRTLEAQGLLDRQIEFLPSDAEFVERKARGLGLTRPELSICFRIRRSCCSSSCSIPTCRKTRLSKELRRYFPEPLQEKYSAHMERHRLKREIIATAVTNSMVNRMGATFVMRMGEDTGKRPAQVARAFNIAREVLDARTLWTDIEALDGKVNGNTQIDALLVIWSTLRGMTRWLLNMPAPRSTSPTRSTATTAACSRCAPAWPPRSRRARGSATMPTSGAGSTPGIPMRSAAIWPRCRHRARRSTSFMLPPSTISRSSALPRSTSR